MKEVVLNVKNVMNTFQRSPISTDILMEAKTGMAVISILVMFAMIIFAQAGSYQNICKSTKNMNAINAKKIFASKQSLETHIAHRVKDSCAECGKTFCNKSDLNSHNSYHHKYVQCSKCGERFLKASILNHELKQHTK